MDTKTHVASALVMPPLSLYIHIPWCIKKCPYCDFNSHQSPNELPEAAYVRALLDDLAQDQHLAQGRKIHSIFFGGGTPSLFSASAIADILDGVERIIGIEKDAEITLEANPGTAENYRFVGLRAAGVNRLSMGVQSFHDQHLQKLGRIHSAKEVIQAFDFALVAGFDNINIDLMHGLPQQTVSQALNDIHQAIALGANHISWYQLTIEPNTIFYNKPPSLPIEDILLDIQEEGIQRLALSGYKQYEISAYCQDERVSSHNMNYWTFGDYLGVGAGAHGKITQAISQKIIRYQKTRLPNDYLNEDKKYTAQETCVLSSALPLEYMMNVLRLNTCFPAELFAQRTGLSIDAIEAPLSRLREKGLVSDKLTHIELTDRGHRYLNNVLEEFMLL